MALENNAVLAQLKEQRQAAIDQFETIRNTVMRLNGAIEVLEQIEASKEEQLVATENE